MSKLGNDTLTETRNHLINEITLLSDAQFNWQPDRESWSIAQVCHHLVLVEEATIKAITWGLKAGEPTQTERINVELLILDRTKKLIAPKIVEPDVKSFEMQQIFTLLNDSRKKLMTLLSSVDDKSILAKKSVKHPSLGELPLDQWIEQIYLHEKRHIEQIKEIKGLL
ncbi:PadR family transcriptional regulator [Solibacillus sp. R5-41]|uniref:DinB family protein n=1 Tax=Solibacillus sp. R5-41 TaxID=2048654 RepID=UPI000C127CC5|nr:DinB family protein [Solibacillus sp. R5-41]ATP41079.1 PadR family transcriptional regulator [Solibacillus sp. R5-41]